MTPYADTNFLVGLYLLTPFSEEAVGFVELAREQKMPRFPVAWLLRLEVMNAIERLVFEARAGAPCRISAEAAAAAQASFRDDLSTHSIYWRPALAVTKLESVFGELCLRHTSKHGFRTYDLLHVAAALVLGCDTFWSFDTRAKKLAKLEGLATN